jgi:ferredoxin
MPGSSEPLVESYADKINAERIARLEVEMLDRLTRIAEIINARQVNREENLDGIGMPAGFKFLEPLFLPIARMAEGSFDFYLDPKCTGCGTCEKVCLSQKISMATGSPVWQKKVKCFGCFACLNYCPEHAVQIKSSWYLKSYTPQNGRYHHPQITAADIAGQKSS